MLVAIDGGYDRSCGASPFDALVCGRVGAWYGDPDGIVVCVTGCCACDFGINNSLGEWSHDIVAPACH